MVLREFRDRFLFVNSTGKGFVRLYNTYSPFLLNFIANHDTLRARYVYACYLYSRHELGSF